MIPLWASILLVPGTKTNRANWAQLLASGGWGRQTATITMDRSTGEEGGLERDPELKPADQRSLPGGGEAHPDLEGQEVGFSLRSTAYLEDADEGLREVVEVAASHLRVLEVIPAPEELHAQQGEDDDEEEEQQQQGGDRADGVEQGRHQVAQRRPVPEGTGSQVGRSRSPASAPSTESLGSGQARAKAQA